SSVAGKQAQSLKLSPDNKLDLCQSKPSNPKKMPIICRGRSPQDESCGFRLHSRNQRRKCAGIADRAWREGQGVVGRPEPVAGDEPALALARTHYRYWRLG